MNYQTRTRCICCKKKNIKEIINLGNHSFADRFIPKNKLKLKDPKYPLILDICTNCKFIQSRVKPILKIDIWQLTILIHPLIQNTPKSLD